MENKRLDKAAALLIEQGWDGLLVEEPINLYYLTQLELSSGWLLILRDKAFLAVDGRYYEMCTQKKPCEVLLSNNDPLTQILALCPGAKVAFDSHSTSYANYLKLKKTAQKFKIGLRAVENPIKYLRMIKEKEEIVLLREAALLGFQGFDYLKSQLREGVSEGELAQDLEIFWKKRGAKGVAFEPIIAFGANSSMPHYRPGDHRLGLNQCVLFDIGVNLRNYRSDMTRTLFFGTVDPKLQRAYSVVEQVQTAVLSLCRPGTKIGLLDCTARRLMAEAGFEDSFPHSLGHGIGLEVHEQPLLQGRAPWEQWELQEGMCITIEPGLYFPGVGGIRLEDTIVITSDGYENLSEICTKG